MSDAANVYGSTMRAFLALLRETATFFWRYPDRMIAATFHHYLGDPEKSKQLVEEMRADADE